MSRPRILLAGPDWHGDLLPFVDCAFRAAGAEVEVVATSRPVKKPRVVRVLEQARQPGPRIAGRIERRRRARVDTEVADEVARIARTWKPTLVVALVCFGNYLRAETLDDVAKSCGAKRVGWLMDNPVLWDEPFLRSLRSYDHVFAVDHSWAHLAQLYTSREVGFLPCGAEPSRHHPVDRDRVPNELRSRLLFVGTSYHGTTAGEFRATILDNVADLDLKIFGDGGWSGIGKRFPRLAAAFQGRPLTTGELNAASCGADIVINIHHPQFNAGTSLRTFAVAGAGAFQIVDWRPTVDRLFTEGTEIVTYKSGAELRRACEYFLDHADERRRISEAALRRVLAEHLYEHRVRTIMETALRSSGRPQR